jgi:hypothetical protein
VGTKKLKFNIPEPPCDVFYNTYYTVVREERKEGSGGGQDKRIEIFSP